MIIGIEPAIFRAIKDARPILRYPLQPISTSNLKVGFRSLHSIKRYSDQSSSAQVVTPREGASEPESLLLVQKQRVVDSDVVYPPMFKGFRCFCN